MQKRLRAIVLADLLAALEKRGYYKVNPKQDPCLNWKRSKFHVILRPRPPRKTVINLHIHVDLPTSLPPYHHAIHTGKDLRKEINRIIDAYQTIRGKVK